MKIITFLLLTLVVIVQGQFDPNFVNSRKVIVHMFEWKWEDIALECERFLGPKGFGGVQVSNPAVNAIVRNPPYPWSNRPWWERYHIMCYELNTRSGNEAQFADMVRRCNNVQVRVYPDAVFNHMGSLPNMMGTGDCKADGVLMQYPDVPYGPSDFHLPCQIVNYQDSNEVRNCRLLNAPDLDQSSEYVRSKIVEYLNKLITLGVAGFRVDSAKHMWPSDLAVIYGRLRNLNTDHGFPENARAYFYHEVIDVGGEAVSKHEYVDVGGVTEFLIPYHIGNTFRGNAQLDKLANWGEPWGFLPSNRGVAFVENHDNERGTSGDQILTYKDGKPYRMAVAFNLAHPYGLTKIMSSFHFEYSNIDQSPPMDANENIISPTINADGSCGNGWVCQHRWRQIYKMVEFRNVVGSAPLTNWWSNGNNQIAFAREGLGFVAFNNEGTDMNEFLQTSLPAGMYCDVISGGVSPTDVGKCLGKTIEVVNSDSLGLANIMIGAGDPNSVLAIHVGQKL